MSTIENLEPKEVFVWFERVSRIPRGSGNEKKISDFLADFAKERRFEVYQDAALNVIMKKPGFADYADSAPVILQCHMDMVCEKEKDRAHDFLNDPIELIVDGDFLRANDTTLGADNGMALAYALALFDSKSVTHPPLELLVTTGEETGMQGAASFDASRLSGKVLLNMDSEEEGVFLVSCAGGAAALVDFPIQREARHGELMRVSVSGLAGGHSGLEINKQRANAVKVLGRLLHEIRGAVPLSIAALSGGSKSNAIARDAQALIAVGDYEKAAAALAAFSKKIRDEYRVADPGLAIEAARATDSADGVYGKELSDRVIDYMLIVPDGVRSYSPDIHGLVQSSLNNGVAAEQNDCLRFTVSVRSSVKSLLDETLAVIQALALRCGALYEKTGEYPAWEYASSSRVRDKALKTYADTFGKEARIAAIHAGLECGLIMKALPGVDAISFGMDLEGAHTPKERVSISSTARMWKFLLNLLRALK